MKINLSKNGYKKVVRYFQVTKSEFKYYNSIFSSSVWNDKPLFRINIKNVDKITISDDDIVKMKFNDVKFLFKMQIKEQEEENFTILEFGCEDPQIGISLIKIFMLMKKI